MADVAFGPANSTEIRKKNKNRANDCYFTRAEVANDRIAKLKLCIPLDTKYVWIEPSVGEGSFVNAIVSNVSKDNVEKIVAIDINAYVYTGTETVDILKKDFLQLSCQSLMSNVGRKIITIGNPPFGKNSSTAIQFFNHAAKFSSIIAFILPRTFEKSQIINRLDKNFHLIQKEILGSNSFEFEGNVVDVPCIWCVWVKSNTEPRHKSWFFKNSKRTRIESGPRQSQLVSFTKHVPEATMMIQRVGNAAGRVTFDRSEMEKKSESANFYFVQINLQLLNMEQKRQLNLFDMSNCEEKFKTAGMPSIAKPDVVKEIHGWLRLPIE